MRGGEERGVRGGGEGRGGEERRGEGVETAGGQSPCSPTTPTMGVLYHLIGHFVEPDLLAILHPWLNKHLCKLIQMQASQCAQ